MNKQPRYPTLKDWIRKPLRWGFWYSIPPHLTQSEWDEWRLYMLTNHTFQYTVRVMVSEWQSAIARTLRDWKYSIKVLFFPYHSEIRKSIPRDWADISNLIVDVNFAMIESFFQEDLKISKSGWGIDWNATKEHIEFRTWLDNAHNWITIGRKNLVRELDAAYPESPILQLTGGGKTYDELYGEVNRINKIIDDTDTRIIQEAVKYRDFMWT